MQWVFLRNKQEHITQRMIFLTVKTLQLRLTLTELANEQARTPQMRQQFQVLQEKPYWLILLNFA